MARKFSQRRSNAMKAAWACYNGIHKVNKLKRKNIHMASIAHATPATILKASAGSVRLPGGSVNLAGGSVNLPGRGVNLAGRGIHLSEGRGMRKRRGKGGCGC